MKKMFKIGDKYIGAEFPTYFIADIAANHDGDLERAKDLIYLVAEAGADAAKFQHFQAQKIVSDYGFRAMKEQKSHQAKWGKSVFEVYKDASVPHDWTSDLYDTCKKAGIHFFSASYDFEAVDMLNKNVPAHKIGSGDITWIEMLKYVSKLGKPIFIATGASDMNDVIRAMDVFSNIEESVCLMQCNTNYTAQLENFKHIHLNVLKTYAQMWPNVVLGLSDHTPGHSTVLGAVALGARAIEKHFTDDMKRTGPDHKFSMNPADWSEMVQRTRELEFALGSSQKFVAENENETVVLQRRCLRAKSDLEIGKVLDKNDLEVLRPAPANSIKPYDIKKILGRTLKKPKISGEHLTFFDFD